ncbi:MAG: hypothetical protein QOI86_368, partial [Actinomycetota bacterium]|nr:hypothetical protein [Actinomycetota bacterium]
MTSPPAPDPVSGGADRVPLPADPVAGGADRVPEPADPVAAAAAGSAALPAEEGAAQVAEVAARLAVTLPGRVERDVPFARLTTYGLGGPAAVLVRATGEADLEALARALPPGVPFL